MKTKQNIDYSGFIILAVLLIGLVFTFASHDSRSNEEYNKIIRQKEFYNANRK